MLRKSRYTYCSELAVQYQLDMDTEDGDAKGCLETVGKSGLGKTDKNGCPRESNCV